MTRIAVLGAGIMGASTALFLARRRVRVTLFDQAEVPFSGASRWNEGKIHLGYLYAADPSLATARRLLPGGLAFQPLCEELLDGSIAPAIASHDDVYAVHRASVVDAAAAGAYYAAVADLVAAAADTDAYLRPLSGARPRRLSPAELDAAYDAAAITAAFRVPERSVSTTWIADRFVAALAAEPGIELRLGARVCGVRGRDGTLDGALHVDTADGRDGPFDAVVNALWEGRPAVDASAGVVTPPPRSHRHRLAAFVTTSQAVDVPSTVVATGPFGDVKNYDGRRLYLSWYPAGLVAEGTDVAPPLLPSLDAADHRRRLDAVFDELGAVVHGVAALRRLVATAHLAGGWVYAAGHGSLADRDSTLHQRHRIGIARHGRYVSVDTGKYSIAPWLAREVANMVS